MNFIFSKGSWASVCALVCLCAHARRNSFYSRTTNFAAGNIAGLPRCCQQRPVPRTRREQGVPRFVRAPQMETISYMERP
jgi:hypothetical protein